MINGAIPEAQNDAALVFTNNLGQVVFVDQAFLNIMSYQEAGEVTGEPLFRVLKVEQTRAKELLDTLLKVGHVQNEYLDLHSPTNQPIRVTLTGEASFDPSGSFIGADIKLRPVTSAEPSDAGELPTANAVPRRQMVAEARSAENDAFIQYYFTTRVKAVYVLLSRLIGPWVHSNLDKTINETARKRGANVQIKNGLFATELTGISPETYSVLLNKAVAYAANMIGPRIVAKDIENTDRQMHEGVLVLATHAGLRDSTLSN